MKAKSSLDRTSGESTVKPQYNDIHFQAIRIVLYQYFALSNMKLLMKLYKGSLIQIQSFVMARFYYSSSNAASQPW